MDVDVVLDDLREVVVVLPVVVREDNGGDASSFGGDHLQKRNLFDWSRGI